jgi:hypothetical protein
MKQLNESNHMQIRLEVIKISNREQCRQQKKTNNSSKPFYDGINTRHQQGLIYLPVRKISGSLILDLNFGSSLASIPQQDIFEVINGNDG